MWSYSPCQSTSEELINHYYEHNTMAAVKKNIPKQPGPTAKQFLDKLTSLRSKPPADNARFFTDDNKESKILGVRMSSIFGLAKQFIAMPLAEIEKLLDNNYYEARMGAVSIMDFQARDKKTTAEQKKELYDLYIKRHDRINNWDLVDRSAPYVVGGYLFDKSRAPLYKLAKSKNTWERRTAIVSTYFFIRQNDIDETFKIAELLVHDKHDLINKAVGSWIREAGKRDKQKLISFLDKYASTMPRITLRYAVEKLDKKLKDAYLKSR
jgi:3-methyladenine DNA glycosylase AlkD